MKSDRSFVVALFAVVLVCATALSQTSVEIQEVKPLKPTGSLSTCGYRPTDKERPFFEKLPTSEIVTGSFTDEHEYKIQGKRGKYVSWFGVVRGAKQGKGEKEVELLIEHKFFDGMTDCHIMLVSAGGGGDFVARVTFEAGTIPALSLIRVYGTVVEEQEHVPQLSAEYVRVWPWFTFTFTDLGPSGHGNPRWTKFCRMCRGGRIYNPYPTEDYYLGVLGDPSQFGVMLDKQPSR